MSFAITFSISVTSFIPAAFSLAFCLSSMKLEPIMPAGSANNAIPDNAIIALKNFPIAVTG